MNKIEKKKIKRNILIYLGHDNFDLILNMLIGIGVALNHL